MPSPFPGMNPYLEQERAWHDFHESFMPALRDVLTAQVRPNFIVKIDEHVFIHELPADTRLLVGRGDVAVTRSPFAPAGEGVAGVALAAPAQVRFPAIDEESLSFLEIRDRDTWEVVTVIELLSPSNKQTGPDRGQFLGKRGLLLRSAVHYVEIDLLRGGPRLPLVGLPPCDYYVLVSRFDERPNADAWPVRLRERLPVVPIPLRPPYPDARLDLQEVLHRIYDAAGYEDYIYRGNPQPRLGADDAAWAEQFVPPRA